MGIKSKLLEVVVKRMSTSCFKEIPLLEEIGVSVSKPNLN